MASTPTEVESFVLTLTAKDKPGIVAKVSGLLAAKDCNITESAQFGDRDTQRFFLRMQFEAGSKTSFQDLRDDFARVVANMDPQTTYELHENRRKPRVLVMVSKIGHCLNDLLFRQSTGQLPIEVPLIISNHPDFRSLAELHHIPFFHIPVNAQSKQESERKVLELIKEHQCELVVMARYMQVLSDDFCRSAPPVINVHHSTLPSFVGAKPYHQAFAKGVKLVGATAHFATADLDQGAIIEQDFIRITHAHTPKDLTNAGSNVECIVLARAVKYWAERRVFLNGTKVRKFFASRKHSS